MVSCWFPSVDGNQRAPPTLAPMRTPGLLVAGTTSDAGKSVVTTGICAFSASSLSSS